MVIVVGGRGRGHSVAWLRPPVGFDCKGDGRGSALAELRNEGRLLLAQRFAEQRKDAAKPVSLSRSSSQTVNRCPGLIVQTGEHLVTKSNQLTEYSTSNDLRSTVSLEFG